MKQFALVLGLGLVLIMTVVACDTSQQNGQAMKEGESANGAAPAGETALTTSAKSAGQEENNTGVDHYAQGHWDVAEGHFRKAVEADKKLPEAHFNLALSLDKLGKHSEATDHFKHAADLAPDNPKIADSKILKAHVGM